MKNVFLIFLTPTLFYSQIVGTNHRTVNAGTLTPPSYNSCSAADDGFTSGNTFDNSTGTVVNVSVGQVVSGVFGLLGAVCPVSATVVDNATIPNTYAVSFQSDGGSGANICLGRFTGKITTAKTGVLWTVAWLPSGGTGRYLAGMILDGAASSGYLNADGTPVEVTVANNVTTSVTPTADHTLMVGAVGAVGASALTNNILTIPANCVSANKFVGMGYAVAASSGAVSNTFTKATAETQIASTQAIKGQ